MTEEEALKLFAPFLKEACLCGAAAGKLCDTPLVWIHASRTIILRFKDPKNI